MTYLAVFSRLRILAISFLVLLCLAVVSPEAIPAESRVVFDEARKGDLGPASPNAKTLFELSKPGVFVVRGSGTDSVDDADAFVFEVLGESRFELCLVADAAEFKWLRRIAKDGKTEDVAFGSTNASFRAPRDISKSDLAPGKYRVELLFGPDGASGDWTVKIAVGDRRGVEVPLCKELIAPTSAEKMKHSTWPGAVSIFHGHNWGDDKKYVVAIREAGFGAAGATEWQIEDCRKNGLRAFVFIWPHEAATIPKKHRDDRTVLGYYLSDRVRPGKWGVWASGENTVYRAAPRHPAVFTLRGLWGGIDRFFPVVRGRVIEYYHYHWDGNRSPQSHFALLEQFRRASSENGHAPICRVVEVRPEDMRKTRQTIFTSLAYGVRGFRTGGHGIFDASKRDARGVPTRNAFGEELRRINAAIRAYSPVFAKARCHAVYHSAPLPPGCRGAPEGSWVTIEGDETLVGVFREEESPGARKERLDYLLVANRDAFQPRNATLRIAAGSAHVERMDRESGNWVDHSLESEAGSTVVRVSLEEGGGELLRVRRPPGATQ